MERLVVWVLRCLWLALPLTAAPALGTALEARFDHPGAQALGALSWVAWVLLLLAMLVPLPATLTAVRIAAPAAFGVVTWAVAEAGAGAGELAALVVAAAATVVCLMAAIGDRFVDGSSYGPERRMTLRPPGVLLAGPIEVAWCVAVAGIVAGPVLWAAGEPLAAGLAAALGWPVSALAIRSLHSLAKRWIVFVPAGLVVHDHLALADPVLVPARSMRSIGPAEVGTEAVDLTQGALGLVLEIRLRQPIEIVRAGRDRSVAVEPERLTALLVAPSLPGELMREAERRRLPA